MEPVESSIVVEREWAAFLKSEHGESAYMCSQSGPPGSFQLLYTCTGRYINKGQSSSFQIGFKKGLDCLPLSVSVRR